MALTDDNCIHAIAQTGAIPVFVTQPRARYHEAIVRTFVHVYKCNTGWYAHTHKQRCAPGGKLADRDHAAF